MSQRKKGASGGRSPRRQVRLMFVGGIPEISHLVYEKSVQRLGGIIDNGPEFVAEAMRGWCEKNGIQWEFIQPGKPTQSSLIERFNRTFRQDVLDSYMFDSLPEIRKFAEAWAWMYNNERPHSSLGQLTPTEFLLKYGKLSEFPTFQQDSNSNSDWNSLVLNVAS